MQATTIDICSGSLIAENVVVTARHCVGDLENAPNGTVSCTSSSFGTPASPAEFLVTTATDLPTRESEFTRVTDVIVPPSTSSHVCGNDVAVLVLETPLAIPARAPLIDDDVTDGESYDAVGYGAAEEGGSGAGTRRRIDGLVVVCEGAACGSSSDLDDAEWFGAGGPCQGDSGGPALDASGRVMGVVSRADDACTNTVYESLSPHASFLRMAAVSAADRAAIAPPPWVKSTAPSSRGCASTSPADLAALLAFLAVRRRYARPW
jgi:secreted trypsin-like serine protease